MFKKIIVVIVLYIKGILEKYYRYFISLFIYIVYRFMMILWYVVIIVKDNDELGDLINKDKNWLMWFCIMWVLYI